VVAVDAEVERLILQALTPDRIAVVVAALAKSDPFATHCGLRSVGRCPTGLAVPAAGGMAGGSLAGRST
jgi:hypothetical protein